jgi:hypothetical protein
MRCTSPVSIEFNGVVKQRPCGRCIACRLEYSRQWAVRIMHEAASHDSNSFVTLTYSDEYLPFSGSLVRQDVPIALKRMRSRGLDFRYYFCGEYGDTFDRPHYHVCFFGQDFVSPYDRQILSECWSYGHTHVGQLTFESASYVARYCTKKITGDSAKEHYGSRIPEFALMSRRPGIGYDFFDSHLRDREFLTVRGYRSGMPMYYQKKQVEAMNRLSRILRSEKRRSGGRDSAEKEHLNMLDNLSGKDYVQVWNERNEQHARNLKSRVAR